MTADPGEVALHDGGTRALASRRAHGLRRYILRRLVNVLIILFIVATLVFAMSRLASNPVDILLPPGSTHQQRVALTNALGLNQPMIVQYGIFLDGLLHGGLGTSTLFHVPVLPLVLQRSLVTLELALAAMLWASVLGIGLGVVLARRRGTWLDRVTGVFIALAQGTASFWLGVLLIFAFSVSLRWFPVSGNSQTNSIVLPAVALGLAPFVSVVRLTRSAMIETLAADYVRNARARGLRSWIVIGRHALRGALPPVLTYAGILLGQLLSGAVITETIFAWPGIGQLSILGINNGDYSLVEGVTLIAATGMVLMNLIVDVLNLLLEPKAREAVVLRGRT